MFFNPIKKVIKNISSYKNNLASNSSWLREYDLPLNKSEDSKFLIFLVCLMSFLAILAFFGTFALNGMTARWSSGLENKITIEIPTETKEGHILSTDTIKKEVKNIESQIINHSNVKSIHTLNDRDIEELISPWLGHNINLQDIPIPSLISVELKISNSDALDSFIDDIKNISNYANIQTHQDWLNDVIRFARTLQYLALGIAIIIGAATITAIAAGVKTRFAIHKNEIELLHLMGASDDYIARQFQKHAAVIALQGSIIGCLAGLMATIVIIFISNFSGTSLLPRIEISFIQFLTLCTVPIFACCIASIASRLTVMFTLAKMP